MSRRNPSDAHSAGDAEALAGFSPPVREWFLERFGEPTAVQRLAWPRIAAGEHLLVTAPTGSGKTLAAFLWAIDRMIAGAWATGSVRVVYVSPLKALANDIRRNLAAPLAELPEWCGRHRLEMPEIRVQVRSGDTPEPERRKMLARPPEILVTTPESLNLMLLSRRWRGLLGEVSTVILDEVHAVVGGKRGLHLATGVERLARIAGEFQRLALSATVEPAAEVARYVGGRLPGDGPDPGPPRPVGVAAAPSDRSYDLRVRLLGPLDAPVAADEGFWTELAAELGRTVRGNRSTLVFANSRRMVERVARLVNDSQPGLAWSHHGSLSREIRSVVEERLKAGELRAIVATSSLELGIDVGSIDEVALVQTPPTVASAVQRLGRAGHDVGSVSRGRIYPTHARDLLHAAVLARAVLDGELEPTRPLRGALDVLAQVVVSMCAGETWPVDELYGALRCAEGYADLPRRHFDLVLDMLAGRYASARLRSLRPLVTVDRVDGTVRARPGAERLLYLAGGTIPDRGYYHLRLESGAPVGELDEEFVWERSVGDSFTLGVQSWKVERITHSDVVVAPVRSRAALAPFWRADERDRSSFLSDRVGLLLERLEPGLEHADAADRVAAELPVEPRAAAELVRSLRAQHAATGALPHRHRVVVERTAAADSGSDHRRIVLHTLWGGRVNRPLAMALAVAWERRDGVRPEVVHDDDCIALTYPATASPGDPFALLAGARVEELLRERLESTGFFGARFREAAGCALLLPRAGFRRRTPLWLHRLRAKELLDAVSAKGDFPLVIEAWRACLRDEFELDVLAARLDEVRDGVVEVREVRTDTPSPFAAGVLWRETNTLMYADDAARGARRGTLSADLVRQLAASSALRPGIPESLIAELEGKLQRTAPGWSPATGDELSDWVLERVVVPTDEWLRLLSGMARDHGADAAEGAAREAGRRVLRLAFADRGSPSLVVHVEAVPRLLHALGLERDLLRLSGIAGDEAAPDPRARDAVDLLLAGFGTADDGNGGLPGLVGDWLRFAGPALPARVAAVLGLDDAALAGAIDALAADGRVVVDALVAGSDERQVCDRDNLERLLRMLRAASRPAVECRPAELLPLFLAGHQGLGTRDATLEDLRSALEPLLGLPLPAGAWEAEVLPARVEPYLPSWLDALLSETGLEWFGAGEGRIALTLAGEREMVAEPAGEPGDDLGLFPHPLGRFTLEELSSAAGRSATEVTRQLWRGVWRGEVSAEGFGAVRRGILSRFRPSEAASPAASRSVRRTPRDRWRGSRPFGTAWYRLPPVPPEADPLDAEQRDQERVRLVVERYGVVFRELLEREAPGLQWRRLFRSLRLLELAGEVVSGRFFDGVQGLQFASPEGVRRLIDGLPEDLVWWLNAADPASPCGLGLPLDLPRRIDTSHLVFHGGRLVVTSHARGRRLEVGVAPDHPELARYLAFLRVRLGRAERPARTITVDTVNGEPAASSPYRRALAAVAHLVRSGAAVRLSRRY